MVNGDGDDPNEFSDDEFDGIGDSGGGTALGMRGGNREGVATGDARIEPDGVARVAAVDTRGATDGPDDAPGPDSPEPEE